MLFTWQHIINELYVRLKILFFLIFKKNVEKLHHIRSFKNASNIFFYDIVLIS